jgi:hypothetical protein
MEHLISEACRRLVMAAPPSPISIVLKALTYFPKGVFQKQQVPPMNPSCFLLHHVTAFFSEPLLVSFYHDAICHAMMSPEGPHQKPNKWAHLILGFQPPKL